MYLAVNQSISQSVTCPPYFFYLILVICLLSMRILLIRFYQILHSPFLLPSLSCTCTCTYVKDKLRSKLLRNHDDIISVPFHLVCMFAVFACMYLDDNRQQDGSYAFT